MLFWQVAACGIQLIADESKQGIVAFLPVSGKLYKYNPNSSLLRRASFGKQGEQVLGSKVSDDGLEGA